MSTRLTSLPCGKTRYHYVGHVINKKPSCWQSWGKYPSLPNVKLWCGLSHRIRLHSSQDHVPLWAIPPPTGLSERLFGLPTPDWHDTARHLILRCRISHISKDSAALSVAEATSKFLCCSVLVKNSVLYTSLGAFLDKNDV